MRLMFKNNAERQRFAERMSYLDRMEVRVVTSVSRYFFLHLFIGTLMPCVRSVFSLSYILMWGRIIF